MNPRINHVMAQLNEGLANELMRPRRHTMEAVDSYLARVRDLADARAQQATAATETLVEVREMYVAAVHAKADEATISALRRALGAAALHVGVSHALSDLSATDRAMAKAEAEAQAIAEAQDFASPLEAVLQDVAERVTPPGASPVLTEIITSALDVCMRDVYESSPGDLRAVDLLAAYQTTVNRMASVIEKEVPTQEQPGPELSDLSDRSR